LSAGNFVENLVEDIRKSRPGFARSLQIRVVFGEGHDKALDKVDLGLSVRLTCH